MKPTGAPRLYSSRRSTNAPGGRLHSSLWQGPPPNMQDEATAAIERSSLTGWHQVGIKEPRFQFGAFLHLYIFPCKSLENRSGGTRTRTGDTMIFSLGRYVSSRFCQLQNPPKQAELLLCACPDVSPRCFGLVSKLVSNGISHLR
jgi:hypothetical protein